MAENRSDSNAELVTFTGQPGAAKPVEIKFIPTVAPLAAEPLRQRNKRKSPAPTRAEAERSEEFQVLIRTAAKEAGADNRLFCTLMQQRTVPIPRGWPVASWPEAYLECPGKVRSLKYRALHPRA